jgi:hypothetical protein
LDEALTGTAGAVGDRAARLGSEVERLHALLRGPGEGGVAQQETVLPLATLVGRLYSTTEAWTGAPTTQQTELTARAHRELTDVWIRLRTILAEDLPALRRALSDAGIPWPAGNPPVLPTDLLPPTAP